MTGIPHAYGHVRSGPPGSLPFCGFIKYPGTSEPLAAKRHWVALSDELPAHSLDVSFALFACSWHCSYLSRVLGSRSLAGFFTGSWVPIPGCFTLFTALSARVLSNSCQLLIQNHGCRSMDGSSSISTLVTSQASGTHTGLL